MNNQFRDNTSDSPKAEMQLSTCANKFLKFASRIAKRLFLEPYKGGGRIPEGYKGSNCKDSLSKSTKKDKADSLSLSSSFLLTSLLSRWIVDLVKRQKEREFPSHEGRGIGGGEGEGEREGEEEGEEDGEGDTRYKLFRRKFEGDSKFD